MRCLYCGKRIALLRKLTDGEFCSDAHRHTYQQEQESMALARLVDAQQRFSAFSSTGAFHGALNGTANGTGKPGKALEGEMSNTFLSDMPDAISASAAVRGVMPLPLGQLPELFVPEFPLHTAGSPHVATAVPIETHAPRVSQFPMRLADTEIQASPGHASVPAFPPPPLSFALGGLQPSVCMSAVLERTTGHAPLPAGPVESGIAEAFVPLGEGVSRETPLFSGIGPFLPELKHLSLAQMLEMDWTLRTMAAEKLPVVVVAAEFANPVASATAFRDVLRPVESEPVVAEPLVAVEEPAETALDPDAPCPPLRKLLSLSPPELRQSQPRMRHGRARELFFPVSKAGYLQALASKASKRPHGPVTFSGTASAPWKPGGLPYDFRPGSLDTLTGKGVQSFSFVYTEPAKLASVPSYPPVAAVRPCLAEAARIPLELSLVAKPAPTACILSGMESGSWETLPGQHMSPVLVSFAVETPSLLWFLGLAPLSEPTPLASSQALRSIEPALADAAQSQNAVAPVFAFPISSTGQVGIPANPNMAGIEPGPQRPAGSLMMAVDALFELVDAKAECTFPGSYIHGSCFPKPSRTVFAIAPGDGMPYPKHTVAIQELTTLWPEPLALNPQMGAAIAEDSQVRSAVQAMSAILDQERRRGFLSRIPIPSLPVSRNDLKWFVMTIPAVMLLAVYSLTKPAPPEIAGVRLPAVVELPSPDEPAEATASRPVVAEPATRPAAQAIPAKPPVQVVNASAPAGFMDNLRQGIMQRAAVSLSDDFRSGLGDWEGRGEWSKSWSYDAAGFLHTGPLALYKPTVALTDYSMEFLGQIEKKSMGWVYRAADLNNYYASKIILTKNGPMPGAIIERYAVINGKVSSLARRPMPIQVRADMLYRVRMDVRGDGFTLTVQGQVVDYWSDNRLKTGGVGFFSAKGEQSSLRWVEISHQYDFLGRLCAFLAPYSLPTKDGSAKQ